MSEQAGLSFAELLDRQLQDPSVRDHWERTAPARTVALRLVAYRVDHGLSQTALGKRVGLSRSAIARLEDGEHSPSFETLVTLSERLGIEFLVAIRPDHRVTASISDTAERAQFIERVTTRTGGEVLVAAN